MLLHGLMGGGSHLVDSGLPSRIAEHRRALAVAANGSSLPPGSPAAGLVQWVRQSGADPRAIGLVLDTFVATPPEALRDVPTPTLVVAGDQDSRSASACSLAALLPNGRLVLVPGDHVTTPAAPEFTAAILDFLA